MKRRQFIQSAVGVLAASQVPVVGQVIKPDLPEFIKIDLRGDCTAIAVWPENTDGFVFRLSKSGQSVHIENMADYEDIGTCDIKYISIPLANRDKQFSKEEFIQQCKRFYKNHKIIHFDIITDQGSNLFAYPVGN